MSKQKTIEADLAFVKATTLLKDCRNKVKKRVTLTKIILAEGIQKLLCWQYSSKGQGRGGLLFLEAKIIAENMLAWKSVLVLLSML